MLGLVAVLREGHFVLTIERKKLAAVTNESIQAYLRENQAALVREK